MTDNQIFLAYVFVGNHTFRNDRGVYSDLLPVVNEDGREEWLIESIVDECRRGRGRQLQYCVRWSGYGPEEDT